MARIPLLGTAGGTVIMAVALVAHLWMFASHDHQSMPADHDLAATTAAVADAPLPTHSCGSGMTACTAAPTEEPRLPSAVLLSPLPLVLVLRDRVTTSRARRPSSCDDPAPPLSPVASGVLLRE